MKKIFSFMAIAAICAGFAACDEVEEGGAGPQTNPQEAVMEQDGIAVELCGATKEAVSLSAYNNSEGAALVPMLDVTKLDNFPEGYTLGGYMYLANNDNMDKAVALPLTFADNVLSVSVEDWETAHIKLYSKNPKTVESYVDFELLAYNGDSNVRLGDLRYAHHMITVTPLPAKNIVENSYSLVVNGAATAMTATNPEDVYDPATFFGSMEVPAEQSLTWSVKSESGKTYGPAASADNALKGTLVEGGDASKFEQEGPWLVTIDMENLTYAITQAIPQLYAYISSPASGFELPTNDYVHYNGFLCGRATQKSFKLSSTKDNNGLKWGADDNGNLAAGGVGGLVLEEGGCNYLKVNLKDLTYEASNCSEFALIGFFDGWATDYCKLSHNNTFSVWTGEVTITDDMLANSNEFKIRTNGNWDGINLGAVYGDEENLNTLVEHGENLRWTSGAGTFTVTLDLSKVPYSLTAVKK